MAKLIRLIFVLFFLWIGLILLLDNIVMPHFVDRRTTLTIPDYKDLHAKPVLMNAVKMGFTIEDTTIFLPNLPESTVVDQFPPPGLKVRKGKKILLKISTQQEFTIVPNLIGKNMRSAEILIKRLLLQIGEMDTVWSDSIPKGLVISQSVEPDDSVQKHSAIDLTISRGQWISNFIVPDIRGDGIQTAEKKMESSGLILGRISYFPDAELMPYTVMSQSYPPGTELAFPDSVDVTVSVESINDIHNQRKRRNP